MMPLIARNQDWDGCICGIMAGLLGSEREYQPDTTGFKNNLSHIASGCPLEIITSAPHFVKDPYNRYPNPGRYPYFGIIAALVC
jgi:hypothetical protein